MGWLAIKVFCRKSDVSQWCWTCCTVVTCMLYTCAIDLAGCPAPLHMCIRDWLARDSVHPERPHSCRKLLVSIYLKLRRKTKDNKSIWLITLLLSSSDIPPPLTASFCLLRTVLGHAHQQQFSIPEISLSAASSSPLSASGDGNSSSVRLVTLWVGACSNELGTDIGSDAQQFCVQYFSLTTTGLSSFKFKMISSPLQTNQAPLHLFSIYLLSPLSNTTKL